MHYANRLLSTLTQALQNYGVDLSQANISVQVDLGKRANLSTPIHKVYIDTFFSNLRTKFTDF